MVRSCVLWCLVFLASASSLVAFDETIPASEILKVWESTAIKKAKFRFEEISRRFTDPAKGDDPFGNKDEAPKDQKLIHIENGSFLFSQGLGMRMEYDNPARGTFNLLKEIGKSVYKHKQMEPVYSVSLHKKGETTLETLGVTTAYHLWLSPSTSRYAKIIRDLGDTKLKVSKDEKGNDRVRIDSTDILTLAKEFDWRIICIDYANQKSAAPKFEFEFERGNQGDLFLKNCVFTIVYGGSGDLLSSSEVTVSGLKTGEVTEKEIAIELPTPALVYDNAVEPKSEYFLRKDGSKTPYSSKEHYKILDEYKNEAGKVKP